MIKVNEVRRSGRLEKAESQRTLKLFCLSQALALALDFDSETLRKLKVSTFTTGNACSSAQITKVALLRNQTIFSIFHSKQ